MRRVLPLNDSNWRLGLVPQRPFGLLDDLSEVREWLTAQVPGDVRVDLMRAGRIPDPFFGMDNEASQWVDSFDWWYIRDLPAFPDDDRAFLVLEGVDYQSSTWLDGKPLGKHVGMFSRQVWEIQKTEERQQTTDHRPQMPDATEQTANGDKAGRAWQVETAGAHRLGIRVSGAGALPRVEQSLSQRARKRLMRAMGAAANEVNPDRYATVKCQMQFGWDFAPRLLTCGIWDDAYLVLVHSAYIRQVWCRPERAQAGAAHVAVTLFIDSDREQAVRAVLTTQGRNFESDEQTREYDLPLTKGENECRVELDLEDVRLWNPWDRGDPNLYALNVRLVDTTGELDACSTTFGIRSVRLAPVDGAALGAEPWSLVVNGQAEFIRGANWVPLDAIPGRLTREVYAARLDQVRAANVNLLRVWGGGLKEKQAFYDLCDEMGILVWQEFPFAGGILDRLPADTAHLNLVREEAGAIVHSLRNHPALVIWCGGNEFDPRTNYRVVEILREVVAREDGARPFKPASPCFDESHNWRVWHRSANLRDYRLDSPPMMSEFGLQSPPSRESLSGFLPEDKLYPPNEMWLYHRAELNKVYRYARAQNPRIHSVDELIAASQRAQGLGMQIAIEHMRRRKPRTAGVAVWQFDDAWPAISWSLVDYYGRPKAAYFKVQKAYNPLLVSFVYPLAQHRAGEMLRGELWITNDWPRAFDNAQLHVSLDGKELAVYPAAIPSDSSFCLSPIVVPVGEGENKLTLELREREQLLSANQYDLNLHDVGEISPLVAFALGLYNRRRRS